jgi:hypothetical protein
VRRSEPLPEALDAGYVAELTELAALYGITRTGVAPATDAARQRAYWMPPRRTAGPSVASWLAGLNRLNRRPHVRRPVRG